MPRLDAELVRRGLAPSRARAQEFIKGGIKKLKAMSAQSLQSRLMKHLSLSWKEKGLRMWAEAD